MEEHKRRVRYKGTHPKKFSEKYKEHQPEKYKDDIEKIISKGKTPAGMHISIMVDEILDFLKIEPGEVGYDATLGYGGHTEKMMEKLSGKGKMYATDVDREESAKTKKRLADKGYGEEILTIKNMNFAEIDKVSDGEKFDFILADLGVSSMQIDNPGRGFSYKVDGPLDLRLDQSSGSPASERLAELSEDEIIGMLIENSDEPYAEEIAEEIMKTYSSGGKIETTTDLRKIIEKALTFLPKKEREDAIKKSCQRTFQALRIDVNSEFEVLYSFLDKLPSVMSDKGRVAVLTFHSGEDRLVKKAFKKYLKEGVFSEISEDVIRPSGEECFRNPRAKSTKMRWARK